MGVYAIVHRPRKSRRGRGFSRGELKEAALNLNQALKLGIQIDPKRSTKHDENVKTIMKYLVENPPTKKTVPVLTKDEGVSQRKPKQLNPKDANSKNKLAEGKFKKTAKKPRVPQKTSHEKNKDAKKPLDKKSLEKKTKRK